MKTLILGGTRSGKSRLAERWASECGLPVTVIATARLGDESMKARVAAHRACRPAHWIVVEEPLELARALSEHARPDHCLIVDCLTLWLTQLLCEVGAPIVELEKQALLKLVPELPGQLFLIGNETNMGIIPMDELTRRYCDEAGTLHQALAQVCERVVLTVAGIPLALKGQAL